MWSTAFGAKAPGQTLPLCGIFAPGSICLILKKQLTHPERPRLPVWALRLMPGRRGTPFFSRWTVIGSPRRIRFRILWKPCCSAWLGAPGCEDSPALRRCGARLFVRCWTAPERKCARHARRCILTIGSMRVTPMSGTAAMPFAIRWCRILTGCTRALCKMLPAPCRICKRMKPICRRRLPNFYRRQEL